MRAIEIGISIILATFPAALYGIPDVCPDIVSKKDWAGRVSLEVEYVILPVQVVIIHHTVTAKCNSKTKCSQIVKSIQDYHVNNLDFHDIGYNFLVGGDGKIYEGAGWHRVGAHTKGYNRISLGLAFIGNFENESPTRKQLAAAKDFLKCAEEMNELSNDYKLVGAKQVSSTLSPGVKLYREISNWPHYTDDVTNLKNLD